jgi:hypothetical protein
MSKSVFRQQLEDVIKEATGMRRLYLDGLNHKYLLDLVRKAA